MAGNATQAGRAAGGEGGVSGVAGAPAEGGSSGEGGAKDAGPLTCALAAERFNYLGCEFWPTFVANPVWVKFEPGIGVANEGTEPAEVEVDGPAGFHQTLSLAPGDSKTLALPWVSDLKGPQWSEVNTSGGRITQSSRANAGAYHVTATFPVAVWQFNPLNYKQTDVDCPLNLATCLAASSDATALFPVSTLSGSYRVFAYSSRNEGSDWGTVPGGFAVTATADDTQVTIQTSTQCGAEQYASSDLGPCLAAGTGLPARQAGEVFQLALNAGDVLQLIGAWAKDPVLKNADVSGSIVSASKQVQVISFNAIADVPDYSVANTDHMEEAIPPAESMGKQYLVVPPSAPGGVSQGHVVRIYGNVDGTRLTYSEGKPSGAPDVINAGEVAQIPPAPTGLPAPSCISAADHCLTNVPFVVEGDQPFGVASFLPGGVLQSPGQDSTSSKGDPAASVLVTPVQFGQSYSFLVPEGYPEQYADIVLHSGAQVTLDGAPVQATPTAIGKSGWSFMRVPIAASGMHVVATDDEHGVGGQIVGLGLATGFYYAAGSKQLRISKPPVIVK